MARFDAATDSEPKQQWPEFRVVSRRKKGIAAGRNGHHDVENELHTQRLKRNDIIGNSVKVKENFINTTPVIVGWGKAKAANREGVNPAADKGKVLPTMMGLAKAPTDEIS